MHCAIVKSAPNILRVRRLIDYHVAMDTTAYLPEVQRLIARVSKRKGDWPAIAWAAGVSYSWLQKFADGTIGNPTVNSVDGLRRALRMRRAELALQYRAARSAANSDPTETQVAA